MSDTKPTNPKDAVGIAKIPASVIPRTVLAEVALGLFEGARKYGRHNYREAGVRASVYFDALNRHGDRFWEGEDTDPDSGLSHVTKMITTLMVLRDSMISGNWVDDRPPRTAPPGFFDDLNAKAKALLEKYPNAPPAHTEVTRARRTDTAPEAHKESSPDVSSQGVPERSDLSASAQRRQ